MELATTGPVEDANTNSGTVRPQRPPQSVAAAPSVPGLIRE
ncbi:hypothetical protein J2S22_000529 [Rhodoplanes tepidamans]|nr:hypothetical protein [Rhodoplanes tepidamans]